MIHFSRTVASFHSKLNQKHLYKTLLLMLPRHLHLWTKPPCIYMSNHLPKGGAERTTGRSFRRVRCLVSRRHAPKDAARTPKSTSVAPVERTCSQHLLTTHSQAADLGNQETHSFTPPKTNLRKGYRAEQYHSAVPLAGSARACTPPAS